MSLTRRLGVRNMFLSFLETGVFFFFLVPLYFLLTSLLFVGLAAALGSLKEGFALSGHGGVLGSLTALLGALPVWMWILQGAGFLLLITIYWSPGDEASDRTEVLGLILFLLTVVGFLGLYHWRFLGDLAATYWQILKG